MEPIAMAVEPPPSELKIVADVTCTACGCACDDIELTVQNNRILQASKACPQGEDWFCQEFAQPEHCCTLNGEPASLESGFQRAAEILATGKSPLVLGLSALACEAQRVAVGIADWIGGTVDWSTGDADAAATLAMQSVGEVTCTLGEVANRGDFILFWGTNPAESHPRHFERYSLRPQGMFTPQGREGRKCVVVDSKRTATANEADLFLQIEPDKNFEALWALRALAKGMKLEAQAVQQQTGIPLAAWQDLLAQMKRAKYGVVFYGAELATTAVAHAPCEALFSLVRDLNGFTRFSALPNLGRGNAAGAASVLTWLTGYPLGVNFARGYPRYNPGETTAVDVLARGEADCGLVLGGDASLEEFATSAREPLRRIPLVVLNPPLAPPCKGGGFEARAKPAAVEFAVATSGIHSGGTIFRQDNVPLPLRPALVSSLPSELEILTEIETRVQAIRCKAGAS